MKSPSKTVFEAILVIAVVFALAVSPIAAKAEPMKKRGPVPFSEFDADENGFVSEEEFNTTRANHMAKMAEQGKPMRGMATAPSFSDLDKDGDMQLSEDELKAGHKAHMKAMMKDRHMGMHKGKGCGNKMADAEDTGKDSGKKEHKTTFEDIDSDGDGNISRDEFAAHQASHHGGQH